MAIDPVKLASLQSRRKPAVAAYWLVEWDPDDSGENRYYSDKIYNQIPPFINIGVTIEARILNSLVKDTVFEINPDLRTEKITLTFDDIDKEITDRFQTFKSGIRCELFFYWPEDDLTVSFWSGQLQAPSIYGYKKIQTTATNGSRSREQTIGSRSRPRECTSNYGGWMPTMFASETNLCPANIHLPGGTIGNGDLDCPRDSVATCNLKLGTSDGKYFGGFNTAAAPIQVPPHDGGVAISRGNQSALSEPIRVIFGQKYVRSLPLLVWRRNGIGPSSFVAAIHEIGEGPIHDAFAFKVMGRTPAFDQFWLNKGTRGQPRASYAPDISNFSNTAHLYTVNGPIDPATVSAEDLDAECRVAGYAEVAVFSDATTYARQWTDSRVWCLFEVYTNQRFGMANPSANFTILDWIAVDYETRYDVSFTALFADGESVVYAGRRTTLDVAMDARPVAETVEDICRSGAISVPFQHEGKYTLTHFRKATSGELSGAKVFTDTGGSKNIIWNDGQPAISLGVIPDDKLVNEIELKFEEGTNTDIERPVTFDDPNQKLKAGRVLGGNNLQAIKKKFAAYGIRYLQEVARLGYRLLRFGEFDEGGTQNNLRATFTTPFEQALGVKRFEIIKIVSSLLDPFTIGTDDGVNDFVETPEYFRVLRLKKLANGLVEVTAQAYNHTAYSAFETVTDDTPGAPATAPIYINPPPPPTCRLAPGTITYDPVTGLLEVPVPPHCCPVGQHWDDDLNTCVPD